MKNITHSYFRWGLLVVGLCCPLMGGVVAKPALAQMSSQEAPFFVCPSNDSSKLKEEFKESILTFTTDKLSTLTDKLRKQLPNYAYRFRNVFEYFVNSAEFQSSVDFLSSQLASLAQKSLTAKDASGFDTREWYSKTLDAAIEYAASRQAPHDNNVYAAVIEFDVANLGGLNDTLTNSLADYILKRLFVIASKAFFSGDFRNNIVVCPVRNGGDEFSFIAVSQNPLNMQKLWESAKESHFAIDSYQRSMGVLDALRRETEDAPVDQLLVELQNTNAIKSAFDVGGGVIKPLQDLLISEIRHPKHAEEPDAQRFNGLGIYFSVSKITPPVKSDHSIPGGLYYPSENGSYMSSLEKQRYVNNLKTNLGGPINIYKKLGLETFSQLLQDNAISYRNPIPPQSLPPSRRAKPPKKIITPSKKDPVYATNSF